MHNTETRMKRRGFLDLLDRARAEMHKEILGLNDLIDAAISCLIAPGRKPRDPYGGHLLIEGAHGLGKTEFVKTTFARVFGLRASRIQFTVDLDPASITGSSVQDPVTKEFVFKPGPLFFANLVLADEITRAPGKTQSRLFEAMAEGTVTEEGVTHPLPRPFVVMATTNIAEEVGAVLYELPVGQRDRFFRSIRVGRLAEGLERKLYARPMPIGVEEPEQVFDIARIEEMPSFIADNYVIEEGSPLNDYITGLVLATHIEHSVLYGASHRAGIDLARAAQTAAFLADDDMVTEKHVLSEFEPVMRLRIMLMQVHDETYTDRRSVEEILSDIVDQTPLFRRA